MAALGNDRVIIGESGFNSQSGQAHIYNTNGTRLQTFDNPSPKDLDVFGGPINVLGDDLVIMSASGHDMDTDAVDTGAVYLFDTNATFLRIINNPLPGDRDRFGGSLAIVGNDRVIIGANLDDSGGRDTGAAYLYHTNGTLLTTFTNPAPMIDEFFGGAIATVGTDLIAIGAAGNNTGAVRAGAAYLFHTNGTHQLTFTNPAPAFNDLFGASIAGFGNDRIVISAHQDDMDGIDAGLAYLYDTNGNVLSTIRDPRPTANGRFGSLAAMINNRLLIGRFNFGTAYLFSLAPAGSGPTLSIVSIGAGQAEISWTPNTPGFVLQETLGIPSISWMDSPSGADNPVTVPLSGGAKFYRLSAQ